MSTGFASSEAWFCAAYEASPPLGLLHDRRRQLAPRLPIFFIRVANGAFRLYLPPEGRDFAQALAADRRLQPFRRSEKPSDTQAVNVLFAMREDVERHFPRLAAGMYGRKNVVPIRRDGDES